MKTVLAFMIGFLFIPYCAWVTGEYIPTKREPDLALYLILSPLVGILAICIWKIFESENKK